MCLIYLLIFIGFRVGVADIEMNLTRALLHSTIYDRTVRPAEHHRDATNVFFDLSLAQLIDVDEKNQIITTNQWLTMVNIEQHTVESDRVHHLSF